jgi:superfamily II DNA or RNA helicase
VSAGQQRIRCAACGFDVSYIGVLLLYLRRSSTRCTSFDVANSRHEIRVIQWARKKAIEIELRTTTLPAIKVGPDASGARQKIAFFPMIELSFAAGTVELRADNDDAAATVAPRIAKLAAWDPRTSSFRAPGAAYADVVRALVGAQIPYRDAARRYTELSHGARIHRDPRPYQSEALAAWRRHRCRGVVVLPTGAGKSHLGVLAIDDRRRSTLVVAPTLDLVRQWYDLLRASFGMPIGVVGGGEHDVQPLTVTTYDSAHLHIEHLGARFGFVIFDECHHLPSGAYSFAAQGALAPYRLGLTATPERGDGKHADLEALIGPTVYRKDIVELSGEYLSDYDVERVAVELTDEERLSYESERALYKTFVAKMGIRMTSPAAFGQFIMLSSRSAEGRRAMAAYRRQRQLAFAAPAKLDYVEHLLSVHRTDRTILFAEDNATAYEVSRRFLVPAITHQTKVRERSDILAGLADGRFGAVATSRVLNEGVDVPEANVAVVLSGSGSVREHVQRLGRILRKKAGKRAVLYELVTAGTAETFTSDRRREHSAYR